MARTEAQEKVSQKYQRENTKSVNLRFFMNNDSDKTVYEYLASLDNKNGYIKRLIREDMERNA